jgi:MFS transporter, DHA2 family, multidrug resistance protein
MADISSSDCLTSRAAGKGEKRSNVGSTQGNSLLQAQQQAVQWIGQQVQTQASFLGYMDAFWVLMLISISAVPLALALGKVKFGDPVYIGH